MGDSDADEDNSNREDQEGNEYPDERSSYDGGQSDKEDYMAVR